ncbi:MAG: LysR family transcriptional regulator [Lachnospiraceae bacterium]|nr:LysR family transcriptional regulator [Lachnospiraceae bacterium]
MTINQLLYFTTIVDEKNFMNAAETLHMSQSSLSKSIQRLEDELEVSLFDRSKRTSILTPQGKIFYQDTLKTLQAYDQSIHNLKMATKSDKERVHLITLPILSQYDLTNRLRAFTEQNENVELVIDEMEDMPIRQALEDATCDIAITRKEVLNSGNCTYYPAVTDHLVALLPLSHPLAGRSCISLQELREDSFILMNRYISIYSMCINACKESGFTPNVLRTARIESILSTVEIGEGVSLLMEKSLTVFNHEHIAVIPLEETISSTVVVAVPKKNKSNPVIKILLKELLS